MALTEARKRQQAEAAALLMMLQIWDIYTAIAQNIPFTQRTYKFHIIITFISENVHKMPLNFLHKLVKMIISEKCVPKSPLHKGSPATER